MHSNVYVRLDPIQGHCLQRRRGPGFSTLLCLCRPFWFTYSPGSAYTSHCEAGFLRRNLSALQLIPVNFALSFYLTLVIFELSLSSFNLYFLIFYTEVTVGLRTPSLRRDFTLSSAEEELGSNAPHGNHRLATFDRLSCRYMCETLRYSDQHGIESVPE